jgi:hypothetical protein
MKKLLIVAVALGVFMATGVLSTGQVRADEVNKQPFWQRVAEKFGLNQDEVQTFVQEERGQRREQMQANREEKLDQAVSDGVLTSEQKEALEVKHEEMRQEREANRETHKAEMDSWFESQGIEHETLMNYMGGPREGVRRGFRGK